MIATWDLSLFPSGPVRQSGTGTLIEGPTARPVAARLGWDGLAGLLTKFLRYPGRRLDLPSDRKGRRVDCWSPAVYAADTARRAAKAVIEVTCLVLDFDDGTAPGEAAAAFRNWWHLGHTSWSHGVEGKAAFRLVLPLLYPVPASVWARG